MSLSAVAFGGALVFYNGAMVAVAIGREPLPWEREFTFSIVIPIVTFIYFGLAVWAFSENCMSTQFCPVVLGGADATDADPNHTIIPMTLFMALFAQGVVSACRPPPPLACPHHWFTPSAVRAPSRPTFIAPPSAASRVRRCSGA